MISGGLNSSKRNKKIVKVLGYSPKRITIILVKVLFYVMITIVFLKLTKDSSEGEISHNPHHEELLKDSNEGQISQKHISHNDELQRVTKKRLRILDTKIDWHNYTHIELEKQRVGLGEQGLPVSSENISQELRHKIYQSIGYDGALSDIISPQRSLPDTRPAECSKILYKKDLPTVSIIIPIYNEHFSVLLRTLWSIVNRTPKELLEEIILIDDMSSNVMLKTELDNYVRENLPIVKIKRLEVRSGLITARLAGAQMATGQVLMIADAHCEFNVNWLPPLLDIIADDYKTCACPSIDGVDAHTFRYTLGGNGRGVFDWNLTWKVFRNFKRHKVNPTLPYENPMMCGGFFAISSKFFWELGGYDRGLYIWGGEQFELSFKIWQCGGRMVDVPCSRVGHVNREFNNFGGIEYKVDFICLNNRRVAEVWMDEYKEYFYMRFPKCLNVSYGDISEQLALKKKLQCKSFKWYMENVAYDVPLLYPMIEPSCIAYGKIQNVGYPSLCVETSDNPLTINITQCSPNSIKQMILFGWRGEITNNRTEYCWDIKSFNDEKVVALYNCHMYGGNQLWKYDEVNKHIIHIMTDLCLTVKQNSTIPYLKPCQKDDINEQWTLQNFNKEQYDYLPKHMENINIYDSL